MNKLIQLSKMTKVVADTGDIDQIKQFKPEDATTNPSLLLKAAAMPEYAYLLDGAIKQTQGLSGVDRINEIMADLAVGFGVEILKTVPGRVSTEVDARLSYDTEATISYARDLIQRYAKKGIDKQRVLIKIASTWEGIEAAKVLEKEDIHCNLTLMFNIAQAVACAEGGITLISPFVGRITDWYKKALGQNDFPAVSEDEGVLSVKEIYAYYKRFGFKTTVMGASFRHVGQVEALAGCDALTIAPNLLSELESDESNLPQCLKAEDIDQSIEKIDASESSFRWLMSEDAMATEKLAEGIRNFAVDTRKLEDMISKKI